MPTTRAAAAAAAATGTPAQQQRDGGQEESRSPSPIPLPPPSLPSSLVFYWVSPLMERGLARQLSPQDLLPLPADMPPQCCGRRLWRRWEGERRQLAATGGHGSSERKGGSRPSVGAEGSSSPASWLRGWLVKFLPPPSLLLHRLMAHLTDAQAGPTLGHADGESKCLAAYCGWRRANQRA